MRRAAALMTALALALALTGCFDALGADVRGRGRWRSSTRGLSSTPDAGPPDTGTCPGVDCELAVNQYAVNFDGVDDRFNSVSTTWANFHPGLMECCYLATNAAWSTGTVETVFEKYDAVTKTGFGHQVGGTNQNAVFAPGASGTPTELMRADAGVPTTPIATCVVFDMQQSGNATKFDLWRTGADAGNGLASVGNKVAVGATSGTEIRTNAQPLSIGARYVADGGASSPGSFKLSEFICFDGNLSADQRNSLFTYDGGVNMADPRGHENWDQCLVWYSFGENGVDEIADGGIVVRDRCGANDLVALGTNDGGPTRVSWP